MKTTILILASGLAGVFADPLSDQLACYDRSAEVVNAIANFCSAENLTIPSVYANAGFRSSGNAFVSADGHCDPPDQVSEDVCNDRFYTVCAGGNANGTGQGIYGTNNCTLWAIYNDNGNTTTATAPSLTKRAASATSLVAEKAKSAVSGVKAAADEVLSATDTAREYAFDLQESIESARASATNTAHPQQHSKASKKARGEQKKKKPRADHEV